MAVRIESLAEPLPGYRLLERLGGGGFGEVWKCEAPGGLHKAIKFVHGDISATGDSDRRAEQELKALSRVKTVRHPYILSLERYDIIDGQLMIVMELADRNLWDRFKECRARGLPGIPREELLEYLKETAEALDLMNVEYQLQHLDIKPQNIFLIHNHIKVADFGLVKDLEGMRASMTGGVTPVYAAPETFDGWVSRFCDQYSLAIVYQELLTGQRPFTGNNVRQLILQHMQAPPNVEPLPPSERAAIARALSKTPNDRFPSCRELVAALKNGSSNAAPTENAAPVSDAAPTARAPITDPRSLCGNEDAQENPKTPASGEQATACLLPNRQTSPAATLNRSILGPNSIVTWTGRQCPAEINGSGLLFPALLIGLGHLGMTVVQRLNQELQLHLGGIERLPHLRLMVLDTDPEVTRAATRGTDSARLGEANILLAPLNRPSHYLKTREGRPEVENWLHKRMLYRIPRSLVTTGVRALGRLAFYDNYHAIMHRLQVELDACIDPEALSSAVQQTGLGLRTNRVRVYVIASLAGGTGSGMFLDVAYNVRALLKQAGCQQPDVVGLFLLPNVDRNRTRTLTLGNACAALRELSYFGRHETVFTAKYHPREPAFQDSDPPFARTILLPLPDETDERGTRRMIETAGLFLARDLCSSLGPAADLGRGGITGTPWESRGLYYQTFGLNQMSWPRQELLGTLARRLCQRLVRHWMSKDSKPIREAVRAWVEEQWTQQQLGSSLLVERLSEISRQEIGQNPEEIFQGVIQSLWQTTPQSTDKPDNYPLPNQLLEILEQFEQLLGRPQDDGLSETPGRLVLALRDAAGKLVQEWGQKLAELPVRLIEAPEFRLAGAEEGIRQMTASIEQTLQNHEPLARELSVRAAELHDRLLQYLASPTPPPPSKPHRSGLSGVLRKVSSGSRKLSPLAELQELLRAYPKTLYQCLMLRQAGLVFLTLRGQLADEMREVNFCRNRLGELLNALEEVADSTQAEASTRKYLYPAGCKDLNEAVEFFEEKLQEDALNELDRSVQAMLKKQFTALVNVCLGGSNAVKNVEAAMRRTAEQFVAGLLGEVSVAEMFQSQHPDEDQAGAALADMFHGAVPQLPATAVPAPQAGQSVELCVLAAPSDPAGDHLRTLAAKALSNVEWQAASGEADILLYRERANLPLSELPQLGPLAQDAYRQMSNAENFTPHCRCDVNFDES